MSDSQKQEGMTFMTSFVDLCELGDIPLTPETHCCILDMQGKKIGADPEETLHTLIVSMPRSISFEALSVFKGQNCLLAMDSFTGVMANEMVNMVARVKPRELTLWNTDTDQSYELISNSEMNTNLADYRDPGAVLH